MPRIPKTYLKRDSLSGLGESPDSFNVYRSQPGPRPENKEASENVLKLRWRKVFKAVFGEGDILTAREVQERLDSPYREFEVEETLDCAADNEELEKKGESYRRPD